ncbi:hypothetical protein ACNHUS_23300 [Actinomycetes bacterium M1A6_2h]
MITRIPAGPPVKRPTKTRRSSVWKSIAALAAVAIALVSASYAEALLAPGYATWSDKTSSWLRDHGAGPVVDAYENWKYAEPPADTQPDMGAFGAPTGSPPPNEGTPGPGEALPTLPATAGQPAPTWVPGRAGPDGVPVSYTSAFQPDPSHRSIVAGVAIVRQSASAAHLVEGTTQPIPNQDTPGAIPAAGVPSLVAAFNSGFKLTDTDGGFLDNGRLARPLVDGEASMVIDDRGKIAIGAWGREVTMSSHVAAVRQNLALVVDNAAPVAGIDSNGDLRWGSAQNQLQFTERSALGITAAGDLVYVAAAKIDLRTLARALAGAGAVRGLELDIHPGTTAFNSWTQDAAGRLTPHVLLPSVHTNPDRYLDQDRRDFFYLTLRAGTPHQPWGRSDSAAVQTTSVLHADHRDQTGH